MKDFNQKEFNDLVLKICKIDFYDKDIILSSGRKSRLYFKWRLNDTYYNDVLGSYIINFTKNLGLKPDCFHGVPHGVSGLAAITNLKWARQSQNYGPDSHAFPVGRKSPKESGEKIEYFRSYPFGDTIILEDTVTAGTKLFPEIDKVNNVTCVSVKGVIVLTDRMHKRDDGLSVREALEEMKIPFYSMSNVIELLPEAIERQKPDKEIVELIKEEYERYGVEKLRI